MAVLLPDKIDFQSELVTRDREGHCMMKKGSVHQRDVAVVNMYSPNVEALKYLRQILKDLNGWGAWVPQSVKRPTSAQVMTSRSVSSSPALGSVLTAQSLEPLSDSVSPSLSDPPPFMLCLSLSQK